MRRSTAAWTAALASVRPKLCDILPRQGVPPAMSSWEELDTALRWGEAAGVMADRSQWWWEARLHPAFGTVEVRVPDTQSTVAETTALAAVVHALVAWLAERHEAGEALAPAPTWRIGENRWSACRHGLDGHDGGPDHRRGRPDPRAGGRAARGARRGADRVGCAAELALAASGLDTNGAGSPAERRRGRRQAPAPWLHGWRSRFLG
jgi:carboxylate-amine ligase